MRKARKYALDILYSADLTGASISDTITRYATMSDHVIPTYSRELAEGVASHDYLIDGYLAPSLAQDWTVERMPVIDRCLARLAVYEMVFADVPAAIAISEAVGLAKELSTDASASFLTGALGHVATLVAPADRPADGDDNEELIVSECPDGPPLTS
ncbi:MAG: transcription antitermination factor NusB [Propionibacteriaceae bacterium]|jgi:N utilization substance protein B|nr:transcription antitermination factor NusB [Propionibacteriaceae bacterium]